LSYILEYVTLKLNTDLFLIVELKIVIGNLKFLLWIHILQFHLFLCTISSVLYFRLTAITTIYNHTEKNLPLRS
jgi:hypothetical protein